MLVAPLTPGRKRGLCELLQTMTAVPRLADPANEMLPFGQFERLHFARLVVLEDATLGDIQAYDLPPSKLPTYLAFMGDCDGPASELLADLARRSSAGLRRIFSHCEDYAPEVDLLAWMRAHDRPL